MSNPNLDYESQKQRRLRAFLRLPEWMRCNRLKNVEIDTDSDGIEKEPKNNDWKNKPDSDPEHANIVTSALPTGGHFPVLDIDIPCHVVASSSGNKHLYFRPPKPLTDEQYERLLASLKECGIIQEGIANGYERRGYTSLRLPGLSKYAREDNITLRSTKGPGRDRIQDGDDLPSF